MTSLSGAALIFVAVIAGLGLMIFGVLDRRDGLVIAGAILLGSVVIAVGHESGPSESSRAANPRSEA